MLSRSFIVLCAAGLVCVSGALFAEPEVGPVRDRSQTWGDPEEDAKPDEGWTWFGMGYENRARASVQSSDRRGGAVNGRQGGKGKGRK